MYFGNIEDVDPCSERENSMHARVTIAQRDRSEMTDEAINIFRESVMPEQRQQPGYKGTLLLVDRAQGEGIRAERPLSSTDCQIRVSFYRTLYPGSLCGLFP